MAVLVGDDNNTTPIADTIAGAADNDLIQGLELDDTLNGNGGDDTLEGGNGDDTLIGSDGADTYDGGDGIDTAYLISTGGGAFANLSTGFAMPNLGLSSDGDVFISIENILGSAGDDVLAGDDNVNVIDGGTGSDTIFGRGGDDTLGGTDGAYTLNGGAGADVLTNIVVADYSDSPGAVTIDLSVATFDPDTFFSLLTPGVGHGSDAEGDTLFVSPISIVIGSGFADTLIGIDVDFSITDPFIGTVHFGDNLVGGGGNDSLIGLAGNDTLTGGAGADSIDGGAGADLVSYAGSSVGVTVDMQAGTASGGDAAGDVLISIENLIGSSFDDALTGDAFDQTFEGGDGNDVIHGGDGNDTLNGGAGADKLFGDGGDDVFTIGDSSDVAAGETIDGGGGNDTLNTFGAMDFSGAGAILGIETVTMTFIPTFFLHRSSRRHVFRGGHFRAGLALRPA